MTSIRAALPILMCAATATPLAGQQSSADLRYSEGHARGEARVLWDAARHIPVRYDGTSKLSMQMSAAGDTMQMHMTSRTVLREVQQ
ncbi:MAG TPA: hypothetical protein VFZ24_12545 [Longimicrobiales bacterium]